MQAVLPGGDWDFVSFQANTSGPHWSRERLRDLLQKETKAKQNMASLMLRCYILDRQVESNANPALI